MPESLRNQDPTRKGLKNKLNKWVRDQVTIRDCRIIWREKLEGEGGGRIQRRLRPQGGGKDGSQRRNRDRARMRQFGLEEDARN